MFTAWVKNSLLGLRKIESLHGSTQVVNIHYLGQIHNLGQNKFLKLARKQTSERQSSTVYNAFDTIAHITVAPSNVWS